MSIKRVILLNIVLVLLFLACNIVSATIVEGTVTLRKNSTGFNFDAQANSTTSYDIVLTNKTNLSSCGSYDLGLVTLSPAQIGGIGPNIDLNNIYVVPKITVAYQYATGFSICQLNDGLVVYTRGGNYTALKVSAINGNTVTIQYKFQNNGSNIFKVQPTTGCYSYTTETNCMNAQKNGQTCYWNFGSQICEQDVNREQGQTGGGGIRQVKCSEFSGNSNCQYIIVCQVGNSSACNPDPTNWSSLSLVGIACANISDATFCNNVPNLNTMCSWNATAPAGLKCIVNSSKTATSMPSLDVSCTGIGTNSTLCNLSITTYNKPCRWTGTTCTFSQEGAFGTAGPGFFGDINSEQSCQSTGGKWITETYKYTDSYGNQKTNTNSWCEMSFGGFGTGIQGCNQMCWSCEDQAKVSWGNTTSQARSACEGSALGFCQFHEDSKAFNGLGWCEMKPQMSFGGGKSCDSDCAACDFLAEPDTKCNASVKGCKWIRDTYQNFGWCEDKGAKICQTDCFSCSDSTSCTSSGKGGSGACSWDSNSFICKPSGFTGEICFDGMDNDNDAKIDCTDPDCAFDQFCGGKFLDTNNCAQYTTNNLCTTNNCAWIIDEYDRKQGSPGHCGNAGEQCWMFKENQTGCTNTTGCSWKSQSGGFCDANKTLGQQCFQMNDAQCNLSSNCLWRQDRFGGKGHCDFKLFTCPDKHQNASSCSSDINCMWKVDMFSPQGGHCEPLCFSLTTTSCENATISSGLCQLQQGFCEPSVFGGNCQNNDGNQSACGNNTGCTWIPDSNYDNSTNGKPNKGWCNSVKEIQMFKGMESGPPIELGTDPTYPSSGEPIDPYLDILFFGVKDNPTSYGFGIGVRSINAAAVCNGMVLSDGAAGSGKNTTKFYWYLDTDGNTSNGCISDDGTQTGFEFKFKYITQYTSEVVESRVAYQCISRSFGSASIPLSSWKQQMCSMLRGGMISVDKEALKRFKNLYNDTRNMRIYAVVAGNTTNESLPLDKIGPSYYTPGSFDFKMEDCFAPGQDLDGDGFNSENDPDCQNFKKYGFIPSEEGPGCKDGKDNDNDGRTDCSDESCQYDSFFCGGSLSAISTDKTAPSIVLHKKTVFPDTIKVSITLNKPTNATLQFFGTSVTCGADSSINKSIFDVDFNTYHGFMVDSSTLGYALSPNVTYAYKVQACDPSRNCAKSGCINFTTKAGYDENSCPQCNFTLAPKYDAPVGSNATNATGGLYLSIDLNSDGDWDIQNDTMQYGAQISYQEGKNSTIRFSNINSTEKWAITIKNVDLIDAMSAQTTSSTERTKPIGNMSDEFRYNTTNSSDKNKFIGMGSDKFKRMLQNMGAEQITLTVPMTGNHLWHCDENNLTNCVDVSSQSGVSKTSSDSVSSTWTVPINFGLGFSLYTTSTVSDGGSTSSGGGGSLSASSTGGGGVAAEPEEDETKTSVFESVAKGTTKKIVVKGGIIPLTSVEFKVLNDLNSVAFTVKSYKKQPEKVEETIAGAEIYKFIGISYQNMKEEDVKDVVIRFKVRKSWLAESNADEGDVRLRRYKTSWVTLNVVKESEDADYIYYKCDSPGLSYFAITVPKKEAQETKAEELPEEKPAEALPEPEPQGLMPVWLWCVLGVVALLVVLFLFMSVRHKTRARK